LRELEKNSERSNTNGEKSDRVGGAFKKNQKLRGVNAEGQQRTNSGEEELGRRWGGEDGGPWRHKPKDKYYSRKNAHVGKGKKGQETRLQRCCPPNTKTTKKKKPPTQTPTKKKKKKNPTPHHPQQKKPTKTISSKRKARLVGARAWAGGRNGKASARQSRRRSGKNRLAPDLFNWFPVKPAEEREEGNWGGSDTTSSCRRSGEDTLLC